MRHIPARIIRRNRNNAEADRNAQFYATPRKPGGPCVRVLKNGRVCNQLEDDHFAGMCDDNGPYTPRAEGSHAA